MGTAELLDALQALQNVDLSRRASFKTALQATLIKSCHHRELFNYHFKRYFVPEETELIRNREAALHQEQLRSRLQQANQALQFKGEPLRLSREEKLLYTALPDDQRRRLLRFVRDTEDGKKVERQFRPLLETVVKGHLRYWCGRMAQTNPGSTVLGGAGDGAGSGPGGGGLKDVDISEIREADLPAAETLLHRLSQKLVRKLFRRYRLSARRGPFDFRRSLRDNMRFGGSIYLLKYRRKSRPKRQLLLLCDVSASMTRYSTFVLQFIHGLQAAVTNLESFCFADSLEHLSPDLKRCGSLQQVLDRVVVKSKAWGGGTNLAVGLNLLRERHLSLLTPGTTVIIVSDTRTITLEPSLQALQKLKDRVKRVVWLNTLPLARWPEYRSVESIGKIVEMWPCNTIAQLEQVITGRLLKHRDLSDKEANRHDHKDCRCR